MSNEAFLQYAAALKAGQRYSKAAFSRVESPYPAVLDDLGRAHRRHQKRRAHQRPGG